MTYIDWRGWKYQVMPGLGESTFKARYQKPGSHGWHGIRVLSWRKHRREAEDDLKEYAERHGMRRLD